MTVIAVAGGPLRLLVRDILRRVAGPVAMKRWQHVGTAGLACGIIAGTGLAGLLFGGWGAVRAATVALALLLGGLDLAWRWLPHLWTACLFCLGLAAAIALGDTAQALTGAAVGAGLLLTLQITFRILRGTEAVGTGDILLIGAIGTFIGAPEVILLLGVAAVSGLVVESLRRLNPRSCGRQRYGVAYGAHISAAFLLFLIL